MRCARHITSIVALTILIVHSTLGQALHLWTCGHHESCHSSQSSVDSATLGSAAFGVECGRSCACSDSASPFIPSCQESPQHSTCDSHHGDSHHNNSQHGDSRHENGSPSPHHDSATCWICSLLAYAAVVELHAPKISSDVITDYPLPVYDAGECRILIGSISPRAPPISSEALA